MVFPFRKYLQTLYDSTKCAEKKKKNESKQKNKKMRKEETAKSFVWVQKFLCVGRRFLVYDTLGLRVYSMYLKTRV